MLESTTGTDGTVIAFDFGEKRIGIAVGEWLLRQAHPLSVIDTESNDRRFAAIATLLAEWQPSALVVGQALSLTGKATAMTARCRRFGRQLEGRFRLPVIFIDERLSSADAAVRLRETGQNARRAKQHLDAVAAQLILQSYFDGTVQPASTVVPLPPLQS